MREKVEMMLDVSYKMVFCNVGSTHPSTNYFVKPGRSNFCFNLNSIYLKFMVVLLHSKTPLQLTTPSCMGSCMSY